MDPIECGHHSSIAVSHNTIVKTTSQVYPTQVAAESIAEGLAGYAQELRTQSLRIAPFLGAQVVADSLGYRVCHAYEVIDGPRMDRLPQDRRQEAVAAVLAGIAGMDGISFGEPDVLRSPIDAKAQNFHVDARGPALVDISPALTRTASGDFPLSALAIDRPRGRQGYWPYFMGTRSGAMTRVLFSSIDRGEFTGSKLAHDTSYALRHGVDDWCYDVMPRGLATDVEKHVRRQIRMHFLPYIAKMYVDRYWPKEA